jgi:hypothetical protein
MVALRTDRVKSLPFIHDDRNLVSPTSEPIYSKCISHDVPPPNLVPL